MPRTSRIGLANHPHHIVHRGHNRQAVFCDDRDRRRCRASAIDTDRYLLACCRYVELNPVLAGMVAGPEEFPWSTYRRKAGLVILDRLDEDPYYRSLGDGHEARRRRCRWWIEKCLPEEKRALIRKAMQRGHVTGNGTFIAKVRRLTGQLVAHRGQRRPRKNKSVPFTA